VFGRRKRERAAAAEAEREAERHALFARLAERPEHICPFLGLEGDRTGYVDGISDEHRCFAFGDPAPISAEQQTRVCQERGYGNCPRYLRGVLVIPTEELEALRRPRAAIEAPPRPRPAAPPERRRRAPLLVLVVLLLVVGGGGAAAVLLLRDGQDGVAVTTPTPTTQTTTQPTPTVSQPPVSTTPLASASASIGPSPTPEPTPVAGDVFAFYEVSVSPGSYVLYPVSGGSVGEGRTVPFDQFSFARVVPEAATDGLVYWVTQDGDLIGYGYRYPDSGEFRIRAVFLSSDGIRRSVYLEQSQLTQLPEGTPAP
jgi:hypothetical protein